MNKLSTDDRARILHLLCEGNSIRAVTRLTGVSKNTVTKLLVDAGEACLSFHDEAVRGVKASRIQCDEIWSFCYAKAKNVPEGKEGSAGDVWTWTAIDADTKLIVSFTVGDRSGDTALIFIDDLRSRLANRVQLTTDGHKAYLNAVEESFGVDVDYAQLVKLYGNAPASTPERRYSPAECIGARKEAVTGNPDEKHISTSYVERQNLTMRMHMRRFTRLTNGFSKKIENHAHAVALHMVYYNFVRVHSKLRMSPAMAAGVSSRLWEVSDIVALIETKETKKDRVRGPYRKKGAA